MNLETVNLNKDVTGCLPPVLTGRRNNATHGDGLPQDLREPYHPFKVPVSFGGLIASEALERMFPVAAGDAQEICATLKRLSDFKTALDEHAIVATQTDVLIGAKGDHFTGRVVVPTF